MVTIRRNEFGGFHLFASIFTNKFGDPITGNDGYVFTAPIGSFQANGFGLYDIHGNVWEWCQDVYDAKVYSSRGSVTNNPVVSSGGSDRVNRGGSWSGAPVYCRSAYRIWITPAIRFNFLGFRVSLSSVQSSQ